MDEGGTRSYLSAEDRARVHIDHKLAEAGWVVQDYKRVNLAAGPGVAVREFVLKAPHGRADYLLFVDGKSVGAIEAKPEGATLTEVVRVGAVPSLRAAGGLHRDGHAGAAGRRRGA